ncbi:unnamed protein product [Amoebophrya sp. A25]|nr:unnamed protein product [Amoebophrya sp. A25]|eukprot:GSA25T00020911001.1
MSDSLFNSSTAGEQVMRDATSSSTANYIVDHFDDAAVAPEVIKRGVAQITTKEDAMDSEPMNDAGKKGAEIEIVVPLEANIVPAPKFEAAMSFQELSESIPLSATTLHFSARPGQECWKICNKITSVLSKYEALMKIRGTTLCVTCMEPRCGILITPFQNTKGARFAVEFRRDHGNIESFGKLFRAVKDALLSGGNSTLSRGVENSCDNDCDNVTSCGTGSDVSSLDDLEMSMDWIPDLTVQEHNIAQQIYRLAQQGGDAAIEAAGLLTSAVVGMDTRAAEFWLALKLLLSSQREACSYSALKFVAEQDSQFSAEFVEVGLGRDVADIVGLEETSLHLTRKASALLRVLAQTLWQINGKTEEDYEMIVAEFYEALQDQEGRIPEDSQVRANFDKALSDVRAIVGKQEK